MNKTRKLTQGAMLLAIVGVLMAIDRQIGYLFSYIISMMFAVIIVIYAAMYTVKDGIFLGLCLGVLTILLGDPQSTYLYYPISTVAGVAYSFFLKRNVPKRMLLILSMIVFIVGEIAIFYLVQPLLFDLTIEEQLKTMLELVDEMGYTEVLNSVGASVNSLILASMAMGVILYGLLEGAMIHIFSLFILKRFRIMDVKITPLTANRPNPILAYVCMALVGLIFFQNHFQDNETLYMIVISLSTMASLLLAFYGYIYFIASTRLKTGRNMSFVIILIIFLGFPISYFVLVIIGFLYGSGPYYDKLQNLMEEIKERNKKDINNL